MPFQCIKPNCRQCFGVKTGSVMQSSKLPLTHWPIAYYLITMNLKGISSSKLPREADGSASVGQALDRN